jgi:dihydrofolate reductase
MRKVILCLTASFDGFIEGPNGEIDWIEFGPESGSALTDFISEIDTVLYGRVSYEMWGNPTVTEDSSEFEKNFYGALKKMDRYVFSRTKDEFDGNATVVKENVAELIKELKSKPGKNIWLYGGANLLTTFMNLDLVDEFCIAVFPVVLGDGKRLFQNIEDRHKMRLVSVETSKYGVLSTTYEAVR